MQLSHQHVDIVEEEREDCVLLLIDHNNMCICSLGCKVSSVFKLSC